MQEALHKRYARSLMQELTHVVDVERVVGQSFLLFLLSLWKMIIFVVTMRCYIHLLHYRVVEQMVETDEITKASTNDYDIIYVI